MPQPDSRFIPDEDDRFVPDDTFQQEQPGFLSQVWNAINEPLLTFPSTIAKKISPYLDTPEVGSAALNLMPMGTGNLIRKLRGENAPAEMGGFMAGATEGTGETLSALSTPLNIGTTLAAGGSNLALRAGLPQIAKGLSTATKVASAPVAAHGLERITSPDASLAERGMGLTEVAGGILGTRHTPGMRKPAPQPTPGIIPDVIPPPSSGLENISRLVLKKPTMSDISRLTDEGFIASDTTPEGGVVMLRPSRIPKAETPTQTPIDPNFNQGVGDAELAGSTPYAQTPEAQTPEFAPGFFDRIGPDRPRITKKVPTPEVTAEYAFEWPDFNEDGTPESMYHISGGEFDKSTVTGARLDELGIPRPKPMGPVPHPDEINLGDIDMNQPIDLNQAVSALEPTNFAQQVLPESNILHRQQMVNEGPVLPGLGLNRPKPIAEQPILPPEFAPDTRIVNEPIPETGGTAPLIETPSSTNIPSEIPQPTILDKLKKFIEEESGEIRLDSADEPIGAPTVHVRKPTPETVKQMIQSGYQFSGETRADGAWKFTKKGMGETPPILESEVGTHRPTSTGARRQLGPLTDVKKSSKLVEAFNLPRGLMASMDFSAPLRQGIGLIHKKDFWKAMPEMFKAWASEEGFNASQKAISERPLFKPRVDAKGKVYASFAEDAGLKLTDLTDLTKREEAIMSTWAEKVPGVRRSNRAYTSFLNNLRASTFESLVRDSKVFGIDAKANLPLARELAKFVNTASGRGSLGKLESSAVALNSVLFSPRLIASRVQMLNPQYYITANPVVRKEALKSLLAIAAVGNTLTQLGRMAGGEVSGDPNSSDFGKLKIGNTRLDPYGGFQQYVVAASRLLSGGVTSSNTGEQFDLFNPQRPFDPTHMDVIERFGRGKLHPVMGFAYSLLKGQRDMTGKPLDVTSTNPMENSVTQLFIPLLIQDVFELAENDPQLIPALIPLAGFGMGVQSYNPQD
jgi:hypothetical protein